MVENNKKLENVLRKKIRKVIKEMKDANEFSFEKESTLEDLAKEFGYAGPSGIEAYIRKIIKKFMWLFNLSHKEMKALLEEAIDSYIYELQKCGAFTKKDSLFCKKNPEHVVELNSFRVYLKTFIEKKMKESPLSDENMRLNHPDTYTDPYS